jgi:hypothetical protein
MLPERNIKPSNKTFLFLNIEEQIIVELFIIVTFRRDIPPRNYLSKITITGIFIYDISRFTNFNITDTSASMHELISPQL